MSKRATAIVIACLAVVANPWSAFALPAYKITSENKAADGVTVSVRLDGRHAQDDLKAIARDVQARFPAHKIVQSVAFYLPSTPLTTQGWAQVKVLPTTTVAVLGLRLDEEEAYRAQSMADTRDRIGVWLTEAPALPGRLTIFRDKRGKLFAEWELRSGQKTLDELTETRGRGGRRFEISGGDGGYYRLIASGALELGNARALITTAEPLSLMPPKAHPQPSSTPVTAPALVSTVAPAASAPLPNAVPVAAAAAPPDASLPRKRVQPSRARAAADRSRHAIAAGDAIHQSLTR
jgi:hypothetical protein